MGLPLDGSRFDTFSLDYQRDDPQAMAQIMSLAQSLNGGGSPPPAGTGEPSSAQEQASPAPAQAPAPSPPPPASGGAGDGLGGLLGGLGSLEIGRAHV